MKNLKKIQIVYKIRMMKIQKQKKKMKKIILSLQKNILMKLEKQKMKYLNIKTLQLKEMKLIKKV